MSDLFGTRIGPYRIMETLGVGGMGEVYAGVDERLQRRVALKSIRVDRVDEETRARFLREAQILSQLNDPRICQIHDVVEEGDTDYLVLELIEGETLKEAMHRGLDRRRKLWIAEQLADVLTEAHHRGIVHRDLKPGNLMLDEKGGLKVLDFGLALAVDQEETIALLSPPPSAELASRSVSPSTTQTALGAILGTVAYMSPEQARGERATTASDCYSLGLLLQELLTGKAPIPAGRPAAVALLRRAEGEIEPITGLGRDLRRLVERLVSLTPEARPTAREVREELRRLRHRPRRRALQGAGAAILLLATSGIAKYTVDQRAALRQAVEARAEAEAARVEAEEARTEAEQGIALFEDLFRIADPSERRGGSITVQELLERGVRRTGVRFRGQPLAEARVLQTLGALERDLGLYESARELLERSLELREEHLDPNDPAIADSLHGLGWILRWTADLERAESVLRRALAIREATQGEGPGLAEILVQLSRVLMDRGRYEESEALARQAEGLWARSEDPDAELGRGNALDQLAWSLLRQGRAEEAEQAAREALRLRRLLLGEEHWEISAGYDTLANVLQALGRLDEAEDAYRHALAIDEANLDPGHAALGITVYNFGRLMVRRGKDEEADALFRRALAIFETSLGPEHPGTANPIYYLGVLAGRQGRAKEATAFFLRALAIREGTLGPEHPSVADVLENLATMARERGRWNKAERFYRRTIAIREKAEHPALGRSLNALAVLFWRQEQWADAEEVWERALELVEDRPDAEKFRALSNLGLARWRLGETESAEKLFQQALAADGEETTTRAWALWGLAGALRDRGELTEAERLYREALAIREQLRPPGHSEIRDTLEELAILLRRAGKDEEAAAMETRVAEMAE